MIKQIAHVCIHAADLDETRLFYTRALGLDTGFEFERDGRVVGFYLKVGNGTFIEVFQGEAGGHGSIQHLAIEADDLDSVIDRIREHGYNVGDKKLGADDSWQAWTTDPNGVRIEFHEYTRTSRQLTGENCDIG